MNDSLINDSLKALLIVSAPLMIALTWLTVIEHKKRPEGEAQQVVPFPLFEPAVRVDKTVHHQPFHVADGTAAERDALDVLAKYTPDATADQKRTAQEYTYNLKSFRKEWQDEVDTLRLKKKAIEADNTLAIADKDKEIERWGYVWESTVFSLNSVATRLSKIDRQIMRDKGYSDAMLDDLWALAYPTGRYPWEE